MRILYNSLEVPHVINTKLGELVYNKHDHILYTKDKYMNILKIATGGGSGVAGKDGKDGRDGVSFNIQGTDTYANIINKPNPKKGDMWIASDRAGHGIVWTGLIWSDIGKIVGPMGPAGANGHDGAKGLKGDAGKSSYQVWLDAGNTGSQTDYFNAIRGQQGVQGQKGLQGTGIHFKHAYATKADMIAANPNPQILGLTHLVLDTGDLWVWDNPNPPFDAAGAKWNDVGHISGPQGVAGLQGVAGVPGHDGQPGVDGKDGDPLQLATEAETIAGTVTDKANTPEGTRAAYVPKTGGTYTGTVTIPTLMTSRIEDSSNSRWWIGRNPTDTTTMFFNDVANSFISLNDNGDISLVPKGNGKAYANSSPIITEKNGITRSSGVGHFPYDDTTKRAYVLFAREGGSNPKDYGLVGYSYTLHGMVLKNYLHGNYVQVRNTGEIALSPKNGKKATVNGKNILTGKLSGHTLHLDF